MAIDLKQLNMPKESFDLITAMDGFEHLRDPEGATDRTAAALKSGGLLYGRFAREPDDSRPQHIVADFEPVFRRLRALGFKQIWEDDWVWDHQVFQKP